MLFEHRQPLWINTARARRQRRELVAVTSPARRRAAAQLHGARPSAVYRRPRTARAARPPAGLRANSALDHRRPTGLWRGARQPKLELGVARRENANPANSSARALLGLTAGCSRKLICARELLLALHDADLVLSIQPVRSHAACSTATYELRRRQRLGIAENAGDLELTTPILDGGPASTINGLIRCPQRRPCPRRAGYIRRPRRAGAQRGLGGHAPGDLLARTMSTSSLAGLAAQARLRSRAMTVPVAAEPARPSSTVLYCVQYCW